MWKWESTEWNHRCAAVALNVRVLGLLSSCSLLWWSSPARSNGVNHKPPSIPKLEQRYSRSGEYCSPTSSSERKCRYRRCLWKLLATTHKQEWFSDLIPTLWIRCAAQCLPTDVTWNCLCVSRVYMKWRKWGLSQQQSYPGGSYGPKPLWGSNNPKEWLYLCYNYGPRRILG